jgi:hypothetical protein
MWEPRRLTQPYGPPRSVTGIALPFSLSILQCDESAETYIAVTNFKKDLILNIDVVAWWKVNKTENKC